jgi:protoporphyrinogen/coproporphyrinogen III oxidase
MYAASAYNWFVMNRATPIKDRPDVRHDCVVVGAGPAGLAAGRSLAQRGFSVIVLERGDQVGGRTRSEKAPGGTLDLGAAFLTSFYTESLRLSAEVGVPMLPRAIQPGRAGRVQKLLTPQGLVAHTLASPIGLARFPLLSPAEKLRIMWAMARLAVSARMHIADPGTLAPADNADCRAWGQRRFGRNGYEYIVRLAIEPFFFFEAAQASAALGQALLKHALVWKLLAPPHGMGEFCRALGRGLDVRLRSPVEAIEPLGREFEIRCSTTSLRASTVILAVPSTNLLTLQLPLAEVDRAFLESISYAPSVRVNLGYSRRGLLDPPVIVWAGPGTRPLCSMAALSVWNPVRLDAGTEVIRINATAARSNALINRASEEIVACLRADCAQYGLSTPEPEWTSVMASRDGIVIPAPGHYQRAVEFLARPRRGIYFSGDWLTGSTVEGAVRTGLMAAERVCRELGVPGANAYS